MFQLIYNSRRRQNSGEDTGREMSSSLRATGWRPSVADWGVVCLHAAPRVQLFASAGNGWPHNALWYHCSCQSAATSEIVKRSWACVHRGAAPYQVPDFYLLFNKNQSNLTLGGSIAANWGFRSPNPPSRKGPGPLSNTMLLAITRISLPSGISFHPTTLAGCTSVTDDTHTYTQTPDHTIHAD